MKVIPIIISTIVLIIICIFAYILTNQNSKQLELTYKISAGIPYKWEYSIEDESVVGFVKSYVIKDENKGGKVGAPIYTNYVFKGLKKGTTTITFKFINITNDNVESEEQHKIKVDEYGNISLIAVK